MSTGVGSNQGVFGAFPYNDVITPATIAGLVIATAHFLLDVAIHGQAVSAESIVSALIGSIATIALVLALLAIVVTGARSDVLTVGAILVYVGALLAALLGSIYAGGGLEITTELLLDPLYDVVLVLGVGIGVNWIGVDVSL